MANWHIQRVEPVPEGTATADCVGNERATLVTLVDIESGEISSVQACLDPDADYCDFLRGLGVTYNPNDWSIECPPE